MSRRTSEPGPIRKWVGIACMGFILLFGVVMLYRGVFSAPIFDSDRPYTGDFNALFYTADAHVAAARIKISERAAALKDPDLGPPPPIDAALKHLDIALQHRPGNAYAWVLKAQQELLVSRGSTAPDKYDEAIRALRISNRLAPNAINLVVARLGIASKVWTRLDPEDQLEIERQIYQSWFTQGRRRAIAEKAADSILARRIVRRALAHDPDKTADFKVLLDRARRTNS